MNTALAQIGGGGGNPVGVSPEAGPPFPWEAGVQVSPYSVANLYNGNVLTAIELIEPLESVGVPFRIVLYHNSAGGSGNLTPPQGSLFPIGEGWNITYGGCIIDDSANNKMHVVEDDGLMKTFTLSGSTWTPQTGVYDKLVRDDMGTPADPADDHWILTRKNQTRRVFSATGLLIDELGSNLQFDLQPIKFVRLTDTGNYPNIIKIWPIYTNDPEVGLIGVISIPAPGAPFSEPIIIRFVRKQQGIYENGREYHLIRNESGRVERVKWMDERTNTADPAEYAQVELSYDSAGRIATIRDKMGATYTYTYDTLGRLTTVTDPAPFTAQYQQLNYTVYGTSGKWKTNYRDRRGKTWSYIFEAWGGLAEIWNPAPLNGQKRKFTYDAAYNRTSFIDPLNKTWSGTYDGNGNLLTLTNPLGQKWSLTYDANYSNLLTIQPPLNNAGASDASKQVELIYNDQFQDGGGAWLFADRTNVTSIVEPADGVSGSPSNTPATTAISWNHVFDQGPGRVGRVEDENNVRTDFSYHPGGLKLSFTRTEWGDTGVQEFPVNEDFTFIEDISYRDHNFSGPGAGGTSTNATGAGCATGFSVAGISSQHACADCIPTALDCTSLLPPPEEPPAGYWPFSYDPDQCCDPIDRVGCFVNQYNMQCGETCQDFMYRVTRDRWPKASLTSVEVPQVDACERIAEVQYDELGRGVTARTRQSIPQIVQPQETPINYHPHMDRTFVTTPDANGNLDLLTDEDGSPTDYVYDEANRLKQVKVDGVPIVTYALDAAGRPTLASYVNGTSTATTYDDAGRVDLMQHKLGSTVLLSLDYNYTADGLIDRIDEIDSIGTFVLNYTYDKRGRLIAENRMSGTTALYSYAYTYDQLGNRLSKTDTVAGTTTSYTYDVHDPEGYPAYDYTHNNRLLRSETVLTGTTTATEKTWYAYTLGGHVRRILHTDDPTPDPVTHIVPYTLTCMEYDTNQHLWLLRKYEIESDGGPYPTCLTPVFAREFRYDAGGRRRYWSRERDPVSLAVSNEFGGWREYLGNSIYADLSAEVNQSDPDVVDTAASRRYLHAGDGRLVGWKDAGGDWQIVHADHLGSTRLVTGAAGAIGSRLGYSAFGEVLTTVNPGGATARSRYGYCGGWGYEDDALEHPGDATWATGMLHVGARYYAPGLGRFVQRDPIAIGGGLNTYQYCGDSPIAFVDPSGRNTNAELMTGTQVTATLNGLSADAAASGASLELYLDGAAYTYLGPGSVPGELRLLTEVGTRVSRFIDPNGLYNVICNLGEHIVNVVPRVVF